MQEPSNSFHDGKGRPYTVTVGIRQIKLLREAAGGDLIEDPQVRERYLKDIVLQAETLAAVLQLDDPDDFLDSLKMDHVFDGTFALLSALADFYPAERRRSLLLALQAVQQYRQRSALKVQRLLQDGTIARQIEKALEDAPT